MRRARTIPAGERILYGQRVAGVVQVTDAPADGRGRAYLVERELEQDGYCALKALICDYVLCGYPHRMYYAEPLNMPSEVQSGPRGRDFDRLMSA